MLQVNWVVHIWVKKVSNPINKERRHIVFYTDISIAPLTALTKQRHYDEL